MVRWVVEGGEGHLGGGRNGLGEIDFPLRLVQLDFSHTGYPAIALHPPLHKATGWSGVSFAAFVALAPLAVALPLFRQVGREFRTLGDQKLDDALMLAPGGHADRAAYSLGIRCVNVGAALDQFEDDGSMPLETGNAER